MDKKKILKNNSSDFLIHEYICCDMAMFKRNLDDMNSKEGSSITQYTVVPDRNTYLSISVYLPPSLCCPVNNSRISNISTKPRLE